MCDYSFISKMSLVSKISVVIQKDANGWSCELLYYKTEQLNSLLAIKLNLNCCCYNTVRVHVSRVLIRAHPASLCVLLADKTRMLNLQKQMQANQSLRGQLCSLLG